MANDTTDEAAETVRQVGASCRQRPDGRKPRRSLRIVQLKHLLGPGQTAQVPVNDDAVEAVIDKGQEIREQLDEPFHVHALYSMERKNCGPQNH